jgi:hypothetical protein
VRFYLGILTLAFALCSSAVSDKNDPLPTTARETNLPGFIPEAKLPIDPFSVNSTNGSNATRELFPASLLTETYAITKIDEATQFPVLTQQSAQEPTNQGPTSKNSSTEAGTAKTLVVSTLPASVGELTGTDTAKTLVVSTLPASEGELTGTDTAKTLVVSTLPASVGELTRRRVNRGGRSPPITAKTRQHPPWL